MPETMQDGRPWPRISVATPSFNQGHLIEETIRSILLQGYPDIELIIKDGGSSDRTKEVLHRYNPWITSWTSKRDKGQVFALNDGLFETTGEIVNWINSDDVVLQDAFGAIAASFNGGPVVGILLTGTALTDADRGQLSRLSPEHFLRTCTAPQPAIWLPRSAVVQVGRIVEEYNYAFDVDYLIRIFLASPPPTYVDRPIAFFRLHDGSKTVSEASGFVVEGKRILRQWSQQTAEPRLQAVALKGYAEFDHNQAVRELFQSSIHPLVKFARVALLALRSGTFNRFTAGALARIIMPSYGHWRARLRNESAQP